MVRWITPLLGTASASAIGDGDGDQYSIIDVRELVDRAGNDIPTLRRKINDGVNALQRGERVVVCCDHGISRSNSIAAGILSQAEHIPFDEAVQQVMIATGETEMRLDVVSAVRRALPLLNTTSMIAKEENWLLTGGSGFLGKIVAASAPADIEILHPSRQELDLLKGGVTLDLYTEANNVRRILHFASPRVGNTNAAMGEALVMLRTVLEVAGSRSIPVVVPSRWEVFAGYKGQTITATENTSPRPSGILGDTKFLLENLALAWAEESMASVTIFRSGLVFGQGGAPHFLRSFIARALTGAAITTHIYENGEPKLDLMAAEEWADALWSLLRSDKTGLFQGGGGELFGTRQIAEMVLRSSGQECIIDQLPVEGGVANVRLGYEKLEFATGWQPSDQTSQFLADFIDHACTNRVFT
ncbi:MAG: hypothetical protein CVT81_05415 [Alphaproteobacteria bacterium HGW-Alphaproteobacteria-3]|nr:MAG: hypothetical protein CVT81_05415 [Alphaproteobacteria bacterium HGW-Alphaproteobacteria-3]